VGTTLRRGGQSEGSFAALNLAGHVGDADAAVGENRRRLRSALTLPSEPLWMTQVHGTAVHRDIDGAPPAQPCDAAVTAYPDRVLAVLTADCLPVVFVSRDGSRLGVAHAGWRGLAKGVLESTMSALGGPAADLLVWIGPAIGPAAFEVGGEVRAAFVDQDPSAEVAFSENSRGRWQADLALLAKMRLRHAGVVDVRASGLCTYADGDRFYSHRRDPASGRQATLVWRQARLG
jgi:YfiH family protein